MTRCRGKVAAQVLFYRPTGKGIDWTESDLWWGASRIPGVSAVDDLGGAEMQRFGTLTSGETLLYDSSGRLLFRGGITAARGHSGDNYGRDAVIALINEHISHALMTPVFGCSLRGKG
jgi:hypothetical protein